MVCILEGMIAYQIYLTLPDAPILLARPSQGSRRALTGLSEGRTVPGLRRHFATQPHDNTLMLSCPTPWALVRSSCLHCQASLRKASSIHRHFIKHRTASRRSLIGLEIFCGRKPPPNLRAKATGTDDAYARTEGVLEADFKTMLTTMFAFQANIKQ